jgi:hypothetical protein
LFTGDRFGQSSGGEQSPEEAARRYVQTMAAPKAREEGWQRQDDASDGVVFLLNEDWRFRTTRLADGSWVVASGDRCDQG